MSCPSIHEAENNNPIGQHLKTINIEQKYTTQPSQDRARKAKHKNIVKKHQNMLANTPASDVQEAIPFKVHEISDRL